MRIKRILWSGLFSLALTVSPFVTKSALALTFDPSFGVTLTSNTPRANSNVTVTTTQPAGDEVFKSVKFMIPAGWDFASGTSFAQDAVMGTGTFSHTLPGFGTITSTLAIKNDLNLMGHKTHWKLVFSIPGYPDVVLDYFGDGDISTGHVFTVQRTMLLTIGAPANLTVTLNGMVDTIPALTNPTIQGDYTWSAEYTSPSGVVVTRSQTLSIPGTATPAGTNVTASFNNGSSVTFSDVSTGGVTTIASSTTPPPEGTGQFQLSGGLYYDYNSTATFSCPCTVTLPYDPATADPRIYHQEDGVWVDVTTDVDTVNNLVTGVVSSFSFFAAGQPDFGLEFLDPINALQKESNPMVFSANRTIPVNFTVADANGALVGRSDVSVQVVDNSNNILVGQIAAEPLKNHYKANLKLEGLDISKVYKIRVKVGNTIYSPYPLFTVK